MGWDMGQEARKVMEQEENEEMVGNIILKGVNWEQRVMDVRIM